jgi:hypothetical protein
MDMVVEVILSFQVILAHRANPQYIKVNAQLTKEKFDELHMLPKEF